MNELSSSPAEASRETETKWHRRFLRQQLEGEVTRRQTVFDLFFGILLPLICFIFDPIVFRGSIGEGGEGLLGRYQLFAYTVAALEMLTLGVWLLFGPRLNAWCGVLGGVLLAGGFFSFIIGCLLLPFTLAGLLLLIGVLGFTPFLTAFVYLRNGRRALHHQDEQTGDASFTAAILLGAAFALGGPAMFSWSVARVLTHDVRQVVGDGPEAKAAAHRLRYARWIAGSKFDVIVRSYEIEHDPVRRERLARAYREITGEEIEERLRVLND